MKSHVHAYKVNSMNLRSFSLLKIALSITEIILMKGYVDAQALLFITY